MLGIQNNYNILLKQARFIIVLTLCFLSMTSENVFAAKKAQANKAKPKQISQLKDTSKKKSKSAASLAKNKIPGQPLTAQKTAPSSVNSNLKSKDSNAITNNDVNSMTPSEAGLGIQLDSSDKLGGSQGVGSTAVLSAENASRTKSASGFDIGGKLAIDTSRSLDSNSEPSWSGQYTISLLAKHKLTGIGTSAEFSYAREYSYERDDGTNGDIHHISTAASKTWSSGKDFKASAIDNVNFAISANLPGGRESNRRGFHGSIGPAMNIDKKIGIVTIAQGFNYKRGFYEHDIRDNGVVNNPDVYKSKSNIGLDISEQWAFTLEYLYSYSVSYQNVSRTGDTVAYELGYQPTKEVGFALGVVSDRATTLDPDGRGSHVSLYADEGASAYFDLIYSF